MQPIKGVQINIPKHPALRLKRCDRDGFRLLARLHPIFILPLENDSEHEEAFILHASVRQIKYRYAACERQTSGAVHPTYSYQRRSALLVLWLKWNDSREKIGESPTQLSKKRLTRGMMPGTRIVKNSKTIGTFVGNRHTGENICR
jgi:hypothetical protein